MKRFKFLIFGVEFLGLKILIINQNANYYFGAGERALICLERNLSLLIFSGCTTVREYRTASISLEW